jgi:hypothetical protein
MQSFFGKINFERKFTPDFVETIKPLQKMTHKDVEFKWDDEIKKAFNKIKTTISQSPVLRSTDFNKDLFLYTFASNPSLAALLTRMDDNKNKPPLSFMSTNVQGVKQNYPGIDKHAQTYARNYKSCQISVGREKRAAVPLQPVTISRHFEQWGLDIIGEITPSSSKQHKYILTATDYFTKWVEAIPLTHVNEKVVIQFIEQQLITRFSVPSVLVFDNEDYFYSTLLTDFSLDKGIIIKYSTKYYPHGNEVA